MTLLDSLPVKFLGRKILQMEKYCWICIPGAIQCFGAYSFATTYLSSMKEQQIWKAQHERPKEKLQRLPYGGHLLISLRSHNIFVITGSYQEPRTSTKHTSSHVYSLGLLS